MTKKKKTFDKPLVPSDFFVKKLWRGEYSLGMSFWFYWVCVSGVIYLINSLIDPLWDTTESILALLLMNVFVWGGLAYVICAVVGTWRSAEAYKIIKKKKKLGHGWATAAQVYIVISVIQAAVGIIKTFI